MKRTRSKRSKNPSPYERAFRGPTIRTRRRTYKKPLALKTYNFVERSSISSALVIKSEASAVV